MPGTIYYWPRTRQYTLTATTEATDHPVENVLTEFPQNTWQSTTNGDQYVTFDGTSSKDITMVYIGNHNLSTYTTFEVQASDDNFSTHDDTSVTVLSETKNYRGDDGEPRNYTYYSGYALVNGNYKDIRVKMNSSLSYYEIGFIAIYLRSEEFDANWVQRFRAGIRTQKDIIQGNYGHTTSKLWFQRWEAELEFKDSLPKTQSDWMTQSLPIAPTCVFVPEGLTEIYLCEAFIDELPENLQAISTDNKSLSLKLIEKI